MSRMSSITDELIAQAAAQVAASGGGSAAIARAAAEAVKTATGRYDADLQQSIFERIEARLTTLPAAAPAAKAKATRTAMARRAVETGAFRDAGEFFGAVRAAATASGGLCDPRLNPLAAAPTGLGHQIPSEGGFLAPGSVGSEIWDRLTARVEGVAGFCDTYGVEGGSLTMPAAADDSRVQGSLYGGISCYWLAEADQITASKPKFRQIKLEPNELIANVHCTDRLLNAGGSALSQFLVRAASAALGHKLDAAILGGTGAGQALGILSAGCAVSVAKTGGQSAATVTPANIGGMVARLHPGSFGSARWFMHPSVFAQLLQMVTTTAVGTGGSNLFDPATRTLAGFPITVTDLLPVLGTVGDIVLADCSAYALGVQQLRNDVSIHVRFIYGESCFRFILPADGQPWLASAVTPAVGSDTLSSFITLATRS